MASLRGLMGGLASDSLEARSLQATDFLIRPVGLDRSGFLLVSHSQVVRVGDKFRFMVGGWVGAWQWVGGWVPAVAGEGLWQGQ